MGRGAHAKVGVPEHGEPEPQQQRRAGAGAKQGQGLKLGTSAAASANAGTGGAMAGTPGRVRWRCAPKGRHGRLSSGTQHAGPSAAAAAVS